jgi:3-oxoadipate enol-lactonase
MPYTANHNVRLYWEQEGGGEPLLLIMGLGFSLVMWRELRTILAGRFRVILFDNRGVGGSGVSLRPFPLSDMARDAIAVLDAAGAAGANVLGVSMGGMIAQEIAIRWPERVRRLILACTHCGSRHGVRPDPKVVRALLPKPFVSRARRIESLVPYLYDPHTPRERIERDLDLIRRNLPPSLGYLQQLLAILPWQSYDRLPRITAPTLVIHGETDLLVPPANGRILAERIPGARLAMLPQAGHIFPTDQPDLTRSAILEFLASSAAARPARKEE